MSAASTPKPSENFRAGKHEVAIRVIPQCQFCPSIVEAEYDAKTIKGAWAYMCKAHMDRLGVGVGTGLGQRLIRK